MAGNANRVLLLQMFSKLRNVFQLIYISNSPLPNLPTHDGILHSILTFYNSRMFSLRYFHFKYINTSPILTDKLKYVCTFRDLLLGYCLEYISSVEPSVNKQIRLNCLLFLHCATGQNLHLRHEIKIFRAHR